MKDFDIHKSLNEIDINAEWVGLREIRETTTHRIIRDDHPQSNVTSTTHGVMVETLVDGQFGYCSVSRMDQESIQEAAEKAYVQAKESAKYSLFKFSTYSRPKSVGTHESSYKLATDSISPGQLNNILLKVCNALKVSDKIVSRESYGRIVDSTYRFVSSNGSDIHQKFMLVTTDCSATAQEGNIIQRRTDAGLRGRSYQMGMELFDEAELIRRAKRVGKEVVELLTAEECPTETTTIVLAPDQMMLQIHESVGHALELDRILGDERNYAGWSFVRPGDFGSLQYGSSLMNIVFDPTIQTQFASYGFDDGGMKAEKEYIIKNGLLVRALGGRESQIRTGLPGVANLRASSWNRAPIDRMANLNLEPGDATFDEIIGSVERGVFMESNRSWSIDDYRIKFQFGCEYGKLIENGEITKTVRNPNYRAKTIPFWHSLKMIGNKDTFGIYGTPYCGKGEPNQSIRVGHASPICLFENIDVFGGVS